MPAVFGARVCVQDREGPGERLSKIHEFMKNQVDTEGLRYIENMRHHPGMGAWFGYETGPSEKEMKVIFPETTLEKSSKDLPNDKIMVIGVFTTDIERVSNIKENLSKQLENYDEYKSGNIYITTDTNRCRYVFDVYICVKNGCKKIPELKICV